MTTVWGTVTLTHHLDWPDDDWVTDLAMVIRPTVIPVKEKVCTLEPFFVD